MRIHLVVFALALSLPLLALAGFALREMARLQERETERLVQTTAHRIVADLDRELDQALVVLETLATSELIKGEDFAAFHRRAALALRRAKSAIVVIDRSFQQLVDTLRDYGAPLPKTADEETARRVFETGQRQVSNLFRGSVSGRPVINVEVPVAAAGGEVRYVLIMSFQAAHFADLLREARLPRGWTAGIADRNGVVVARSERHDEYVGRRLTDELIEHNRTQGLQQTRDLDGEPIIRATARSAISGWTVSVRVPVEVLRGPSQRGWLYGAALLGVALLLGSALAAYFGGVLARPIEDATRAAAAMGEGQVPVPTYGTVKEANVLITALRDAAVDLRSREEHTAFLIRELAHRAKNQLAAIQGLASQTARRALTTEAFVEAFGNRLRAIAVSHDLLVKQDWRGAWLHDLVALHLDLFDAGDRAVVQGPPAFVDDRAVQNIGYALHELATNAVKHGALSVPGGSIAVTWSVGEAGLRLEWAEHGGPVARGKQPTPGFGYGVLTSHVPSALQGSATLECLPTGVRWELMVPAQHVRSNGGGGVDERA